MEKWQTIILIVTLICTTILIIFDNVGWGIFLLFFVLVVLSGGC